MEERLIKKRLGVFQAITRDRSPDVISTPILSESTMFTVSEYPPSVIASSIHIESSDSLKFPHKISNESQTNNFYNTQHSDMSSRIACPSFKAIREIQKSPNLEQKITGGQFQRKSLMPNFALNRTQNMIYDSPKNSSGSFSSRSFILNNSTEESSREEVEERRLV